MPETAPHRPPEIRQEYQPDPNIPSDPVSATWWGLKWLSTLTPDKIFLLVFVALLVVMYYDQRQDKLDFRREMGERLDTRVRDQVAEREQHRKHELSLMTTMQKGSGDQMKMLMDQQKVQQERADIHMKSAEGTLRSMDQTLRDVGIAQKDFAAAQSKLADAVNAFTKKVGPIQ